MSIHRSALLELAPSLAMAGATGCATKNYVRNQTAPLIEHTDQRDTKTAENNRQAQDAAYSAGKNAQDASKAAADAQTAADTTCRANTEWTRLNW